MEELPIRQRAPLVIAVTLVSHDQVTYTVNDPNAASVQASLTALISNADRNGIKSGNRLSLPHVIDCDGAYFGVTLMYPRRYPLCWISPRSPGWAP